MGQIMLGGLPFPLSKFHRLFSKCSRTRRTLKFRVKLNITPLQKHINQSNNTRDEFCWEISAKKSFIRDVLQGSKCTSGILQNSHSENHFCWRPFCSEIVGWVSALLWELCHRRFSGNFPNFLGITSFKTLSDCYGFYQKLCLSFPCPISFDRYVTTQILHKFLGIL